jgi:hypothetical protein
MGTEIPLQHYYGKVITTHIHKYYSMMMIMSMG